MQTKLTVGAPKDVYEQEADRVAGQVMTMPDAATQRPNQTGLADGPKSGIESLSGISLRLFPGRAERAEAHPQRDLMSGQTEKAPGNLLSSPLIQRVAISATDKGKGKLKVETGGDFDTNHVATDWAEAVAKSAKRAPNPSTNTIFTDVGDLKAKVAAADYTANEVVTGLKVPCYQVSGINLWQIDTASAKAGTLGVVPPAQVSKTVVFKTSMVAEDGKEKSLGAATKDPNGPVFLVTGVNKVL